MSEMPPEIVTVIEPPLPDLEATVIEIPMGLAEHMAGDNPHPNYDDGSDLLVKYRNAKV